MLIKAVKRLLYRTGVVEHCSARRLRLIDYLLGGTLLKPHAPPSRLLDVGCNGGKDFVRFFGGRADVAITGIDLKDYGLHQDNFRLVLGDAADLPFPDRHFDIAVSIGVFEHIRPLEKLARAVQEIARVSKSYVVVVPSVSTLIEPHSARLLWQLRDRSRKRPYGGTLLYLSDEAWLAFTGFQGAQTRHAWHVPLVVSNLFIYRRAAESTPE